jgi:hypothetical protein
MHHNSTTLSETPTIIANQRCGSIKANLSIGQILRPWIRSFFAALLIGFLGGNLVSCQTLEMYEPDVRVELKSSPPDSNSNYNPNSAGRGHHTYAHFVNVVRAPFFVLMATGEVLALFFGGP